jgi:dephospho-CoA kinase
VPVVGLVGTVCSGKSTVARMMAEDGLEVVDADKIGHEVLEHPEVKIELRRTFGDDVFGPDGAVDRARLGRLVFGCQARLDRLNEIVHRPMLEEIDRRVRRAAERAGGRPVVLDMALLIEKGLHEKYCDLLVFVDAPVAVRQARAQRTRGWSAEELVQRDAAQMAAELKRQQAGFVIVNSDTVEELHNAVRVLMDQIRQRLSISPGQAARPNRAGPSQRGRSASGHTHKRR